MIDIESASEAALQWREDLCETLLDIERVIDARVHTSETCMHAAAERMSRAAVAAMEREVDALSAERESDLGFGTSQPPEEAPEAQPLPVAAWPFAITILPETTPIEEDEPIPPPDPEPEQLTIFDGAEATDCGCAGTGADDADDVVLEQPEPVPAPVVIVPKKKLKTITMSPSKLGLVLHDCERCFVREVRDKLARPGMVAEIYNIADDVTKLAFENAMKRYGIVDLGAEDVPRFEIVTHNLSLLSTPIPFPDLGVAVQIKGRLDALVVTEDGRQTILDYKTSKRDVDLAKYHGQLGSYALAMAWPVDGIKPLEVDTTALLVLKPDSVAIREPKLTISGSLTWIDVPRDDVKMVEMLERAAALVVGAVAPRHNFKCQWCIYYGAVAPIAM